MKVLITASTFSHMVQFHEPYIREFHRLGWEVHVACGGEDRSIPFVDRSTEVPFCKRMGSLENLKATAMLRGQIARERYDLIITHTSLASFFTRLAVKGRGDRPPLCNVMHGFLFDDETPALKRKVLESAERVTVPQTDLLLTMNRWDYEYATRSHLARRVAKIPGMGVDFAKFDRLTDGKGALRDRLGLPREAFVLVCAAEFSERKSQSVLIEALTLLPGNVCLVLAGDGALLDACRAQAEGLGLGNRVRFPGHVADMASLYRAADAAVSASRYEGLPFNIMEAMYCGLPVVASRVKGHVDLIEEGRNGLLYEYGNACACAGQLRRLTGDPGFRQSLAAAARASVEAYRLDAVQPVVMSQYLSTLDKSGHGLLCE